MIDTAIILAGGLGTRLRPLTDETPKPLLPLRGKPILQHIIEQLARNGVKKIILSIGYRAAQVQQYFGDGSRFDVDIQYVIEAEPRGTGGAVKEAARSLTEPFFLVWADNLTDINFQQMKEDYLTNPSSVLMVLTPREDVEHFGVAKLEGHKIVSFVEKPKREEAPSHFINAGAFIINPHILAMLPEGRSSIEKDCFEQLAGNGGLTAFIHTGQWFPTDTLEKYELAGNYFQPFINWKNKKIIITDGDETIYDSCQQLSQEMAEMIDGLVKRGYEFACISGTDADNLFQLVSVLLHEPHHVLGTTGTRYVQVKDGRKEERYNDEFTLEEKKEIVDALEQLAQAYQIIPLTSKADQFLDRKSQITFSATGRKAPSEIKATFDPEGSKRKEWMAFLRRFLSEEKYDLHLGGTTSIDVTRQGIDKAWGIKKFLTYHSFSPEQVIFFGDKLYPGGNDYPATRIVDCIAVRNPEDTLRQLRRLP